MNGVTFNNDGTVNVVGPTGQVIKGVNADRAMAVVASGSPQGAAAAKFNAVTNFNRDVQRIIWHAWNDGCTNLCSSGIIRCRCI